MPPEIPNHSTRASTGFDFLEHFEFLAQLRKARDYHDPMEAAKQWKELQCLKSSDVRSAMAFQANVNGIVSGRQQSLEASKKRCRDSADKDSDSLAGPGLELDSLSGHYNQKVARPSSGSIPGASGTSRLRRVFVHCSVFVSSDAFRPSEEPMAAIEMVYRGLVNVHKEYQKSGGKLLYLKVLELRQKLLNLVHQVIVIDSEPEPPRQSRPRSESLEKQDLTQDLTVLPNPDATTEMSFMCLDDWRAACEVASTQEDLALWVHTLAGAVKARNGRDLSRQQGCKEAAGG
jgi:hypothetical protein